MIEALGDALFLRAGYNTASVVIGATLLGAGAGIVGTFLVLRRRALLADAVAHATLPGVALGFLIALWLFGSGRDLATITLGAAATGVIGAISVQLLARTRIGEDAAIAVVLGGFFGLGVVMLSVIQSLPVGGQAGLGGLLLGQAAAMSRSEALAIAAVAVVVVVAVMLLRKELALVAFDTEYARALGLPVERLDLLLVALMLIIVAIGLETVGLVLIVALIVIPGAAGRLWSDRIERVLVASALIGGAAGWIGAGLSAALPEQPTGATIVLVAAALFGISALFGPARGLVPELVRRRRSG